MFEDDQVFFLRVRFITSTMHCEYNILQVQCIKSRMYYEYKVLRLRWITLVMLDVGRDLWERQVVGGGSSLGAAVYNF